ncbi:MAG: succinylglutamate desuccinylase/aspartoacylase family protein [Dehalococcoidia bacterium]
MSNYTRRKFLGVAGGGVAAAGAFLAGCVGDDPEAEVDARAASAGDAPPTEATPMPAAPPAVTATASPTPIPTPAPRPRGREDLVLLAGTEWEATGTIHHSGADGPRVMVLGGVHGNEPGGWMGAEAVADWEVQRGALIVLPRINWRAAAAFERTLDGFGDLNRLYPGHPEGLPMARMAAEITALVRFWRPAWLWDMHESWGFFNERGENGGTAFIGQTVTTADTAAQPVIDALVARVNAQITEREAFVTRFRAGGRFGPSFGDAPPARTPTPEEEALRTLPDGTRGSSSLSMGRFVEGVSPVLIEMGQMNQAEARRAELHQLLLRELLVHEELA